MISFLINAIKIIFLLGFLILIHEAGHFCIAKLFKVKVHEFAIGFGPKVWTKQGKETKYELRLIPLGGFVRLEGEDTKSEDERAFNNASIPKRMAIVAAGATVNIVFGILVYFIIMASIGNNVSTVVDSTIPDFTAEQAGIYAGDKIEKINGKKIKTKTDIDDILQNSNGEELAIQIERNGEEKEIEIPSQYLGPFGGYPTLLDWTKKYALFTVRQDDQDIYFLCDLETGDIKKYTGKYAPYFKYYSTTTSCIEDNVLALSMYGEDNQFYVCLINADTMKEIADPIAGESFSMEDKTLLIDQKELYDLSGNLLYTVEDGKKGELVSDGILQVTYSEEEKETVDGESEYVEVDKTDYYDLKGKKLFSEMDTADSKMVLEPSEEV